MNFSSLSSVQLKSIKRLVKKRDSFIAKAKAVGHLIEKAIGFTPDTEKAPKVRKKRKMSAVGRAKIAAAQKARWAKKKAVVPAKAK